MALNELYLTLCKLESIHPEAAFIVAGDFNKANLKTRLPKLYQHMIAQPGLAKPWITAILTSATHIRPCPALLSEKLTTTPFC